MSYISFKIFLILQNISIYQKYYSRKGLDNKQQVLVTIAALVALLTTILEVIGLFHLGCESRLYVW